MQRVGIQLFCTAVVRNSSLKRNWIKAAQIFFTKCYIINKLQLLFNLQCKFSLSMIKYLFDILIKVKYNPVFSNTLPIYFKVQSRDVVLIYFLLMTCNVNIFVPLEQIRCQHVSFMSSTIGVVNALHRIYLAINPPSPPFPDFLLKVLVFWNI